MLAFVYGPRSMVSKWDRLSSCRFPVNVKQLSVVAAAPPVSQVLWLRSLLHRQVAQVQVYSVTTEFSTQDYHQTNVFRSALDTAVSGSEARPYTVFVATELFNVTAQIPSGDLHLMFLS